MKNEQIITLRLWAALMFAVLIGSISTFSVNAQYGKLISKQAADAIAAGDPQRCWDEMDKLRIKESVNAAAAEVEYSRCSYLYATSQIVIEGYTKELIDGGKSETASKAEVKAELNKFLFTAKERLQGKISSFSPAQDLLGLIEKAVGNAVAAKIAFDSAVRLDPKNHHAYGNRGKLKDDAGDVAGALADYEKALALGSTESSLARRISELKQKPSSAVNSARTAAKPGNTGIVVWKEEEPTVEELEAARAKYQDQESQAALKKLGAAPSATADSAPSSKNADRYAVNQKIEVEWKGKWYRAVIKIIEGDLYRISYDGYDASWDESVPASRIREGIDSSQSSQSNRQNDPEVYKYPGDKESFGVPREKLDIFLMSAVSNTYRDCVSYYTDFIVPQRLERPGRTPFTRVIKEAGSRPLLVITAVGNDLASIKLTPWKGGRTQIFNAFDGKGIGWNFWATSNAPAARSGLRFAAIEIHDPSIDYTAEAVRNTDDYTYISRFFCTAKK